MAPLYKLHLPGEIQLSVCNVPDVHVRTQKPAPSQSHGCVVGSKKQLPVILVMPNESALTYSVVEL